MTTFPRFALIAPFALAAACANAGVIVYQQDFEQKSAIGAEWSNKGTDHADAFTTFSKRRTNDKLSLTIDTVNGQAYSLGFDLYVIDSWDGSDAQWGQDRFNVKVNGVVMFSEFLDNRMDSPNTTFRNPDVVEYLGFGNREMDRDAIYRGLTIDFVANGDTTTFAFFGSGLQGKSDESWGIDNVRVAMVPAPAGGLALGAVGLTATRRRRRA